MTVDRTVYYWWVKDDREFEHLGATTALQIISADKELAVAYPLHQSTERNLIVLQNLIVDGRQVTQDTWRNVECPAWEMGKSVSPAVVRKIIRWCRHEMEFVDLDHLGNPLPDEPTRPQLRLVVSN